MTKQKLFDGSTAPDIQNSDERLIHNSFVYVRNPPKFVTHMFHHCFSFAHPFQSKKLINGTQDRHLKMSQSEVMKVQAAGNGDDANSEQVERKVQKAVVATTAATPDGELQMKHPLQVLV